MRFFNFPLLLTASLFGWAGLVVGISFLEAPLKFTAPHITVPLGVGIGRVVFHALNAVELALCLLTLASAGAASRRLPADVWRGLAALLGLVLLQTGWLLPLLDERAEALLAGHAAPPSYHHWLYIAVEATKLVVLLLTGAGVFRVVARAGAAHW